MVPSDAPGREAELNYKLNIRKALVSQLRHTHPEAWLAKTLLQLNAALCVDARACKAEADASGFAAFDTPLDSLFEQALQQTAAAAGAAERGGAAGAAAPAAAGPAAAAAARDDLARAMSAELALSEELRANQRWLLSALEAHAAALPREAERLRRWRWDTAQAGRAARLMGRGRAGPPAGPRGAQDPATELDLEPGAQLATRAARCDARLRRGACAPYAARSAEAGSWLMGMAGLAPPALGAGDPSSSSVDRFSADSFSAGGGGGNAEFERGPGAAGAAPLAAAPRWQQLLQQRLLDAGAAAAAAARGTVGAPSGGGGRAGANPWLGVLGALLRCDARLAQAIRIYEQGRAEAVAEYRRLSLAHAAEAASSEEAPAAKQGKEGAGGAPKKPGDGERGGVLPPRAPRGLLGRAAAALGLWVVWTPMQRQYMTERARGMRLRADARRLRARMERVRAKKARMDKRLSAERFEGVGGLLFWAAWRLRLRLAGPEAAAAAEAAVVAAAMAKVDGGGGGGGREG